MITAQITWRREADPELRGGPIRRWLDRRRIEQVDTERASNLVSRFQRTSAGLGLGRETSSCAGIPGFAAPRVLHVVLGSIVDRITVQVLPGQMLGDYQQVADQLAEGLGMASCHVRWRDYGVLILELRHISALAAPVDLPIPAVGTRTAEILIGMRDTGVPLSIELRRIAHIVVQGATRSGKSRWLYGYLSQFSACSDVRISGSDVSGVLLRPFIGHPRHGHNLALGTESVQDHLDVLNRLVATMTERLKRMPSDDDVLPCSDDDPYEVVVLEELPGLLKAAIREDRKKGPLFSGIQSAYGRLLAEGAKVGIRLVIVSQRADADIIGGFERGQCTLRLTFPVLDTGSVGMLHDSVTKDQAERHVTEKPGHALVSGTGLPLCRLRSPEMGDYRAFRELILRDSPVIERVVEEDTDESAPELAHAA